MTLFKTRDSALWTVTLIAALAVFFSGHFELLTAAFPALGTLWQARIELVAAFAGFLAAYLKMSPLPLNPASSLAGTSDTSKTLNPLNSPPKE